MTEEPLMGGICMFCGYPHRGCKCAYQSSPASDCSVSHSDLVDRAARWLRNTMRCRVVLSELTAYTYCGETPDAIGWVHNHAILVECKRTRADYFSDRKKPARRHGARSIGSYRIYLTPPDLIKPEELLEGWGLYEVHGRRVLHKGGVKPRQTGVPPFKSCRESEVAMLLSALARQRQKQNDSA